MMFMVEIKKQINILGKDLEEYSNNPLKNGLMSSAKSYKDMIILNKEN